MTFWRTVVMILKMTYVVVILGFALLGAYIIVTIVFEFWVSVFTYLI